MSTGSGNETATKEMVSREHYRTTIWLLVLAFIFAVWTGGIQWRLHMQEQRTAGNSATIEDHSKRLTKVEEATNRQLKVEADRRERALKTKLP